MIRLIYIYTSYIFAHISFFFFPLFRSFPDQTTTRLMIYIVVVRPYSCDVLRSNLKYSYISRRFASPQRTKRDQGSPQVSEQRSRKRFFLARRARAMKLSLLPFPFSSFPRIPSGNDTRIEGSKKE